MNKRKRVDLNAMSAVTVVVVLVLVVGCGWVSQFLVGGAEPAVSYERGEFTDARDGTVYRTVTIGDRVWMAENLKYRPEVGNSWCDGDDNDDCERHGRMYEWAAAKDACPAGWRLPSAVDWDALVEGAGKWYNGTKSESQTGAQPGSGGTDGYRMGGNPPDPAGGYRISVGSFFYAGGNAIWWSASEDDGNVVYYDLRGCGSDEACRVSAFYKMNRGKIDRLSVRCVREE